MKKVITLAKELKKSITLFLKMIFYNTICKGWIELFGSHDNRKLKYRISLCLIFKDEAPFLKEWIDYHLTIGAYVMKRLLAMILVLITVISFAACSSSSSSKSSSGTYAIVVIQYSPVPMNPVSTVKR